MTLRARLTLVAAGVVAVVVALASTATYFLMRHELQSQLDGSLHSQAATIQNDPERSLQGGEDFGGNLVYVIDNTGTYVNGTPGLHLRVDSRVLGVAAGRHHGFYRDISVTSDAHGEVVHYRMRELVAPLPTPFGAVLVVRDMREMNRALDRLQLILLLVAFGAIAIAAAAGAIVSGATLAPVRRLTAAAERIAKTGEPSERVPEGGRGELARLGASFNTMLASLEESLETQRRFVADASHELRTPLTSLQTNIDVLRGDLELEPEQRRRLLDDLHRESQEMRALIAGLLELARGGAQTAKAEFQLDELVEAGRTRSRPIPGGRLAEQRPGADDRRRLPRSHGAGGLEPARERGQVERRGRLRRGLTRSRGAAGARPRAGLLRGGPAACLRPVLPLGCGTRNAGCGARARNRP